MAEKVEHTKPTNDLAAKGNVCTIRKDVFDTFLNSTIIHKRPMHRAVVFDVDMLLDSSQS
jgi:hypothetical protein